MTSAPHTSQTSNYALDLDALTAAVGEQTDRGAAWRFIRAFARDWSRRPLGGDDGYRDTDLDAVTERLGVPIPAALREAYRLLGKRADLTDNQDELLAPDQIHLDEDRGVLVYRVENQSCAYWGIRVTDLDQDDPPVVIRPDVPAPSAEDWSTWLDRVSVAFIEIVLSEAVCGEEDLTGYDEQGADDTEIAATFQRLPIPEYPLSQSQGTRWYARGEIIARDDRAWTLTRARTLEARRHFDGLSR